MKKNIIYLVLSILIGVLIGSSFFYFVKVNKNYVAVFLEDGNIYFGKLSTFPRLTLNNAVFIQINQNGQLSLQRFKDAFWVPAGQIYLNKNSILFIAPLSKSSPIINFIEGSNYLQPIQPSTLPSIPSQPQSSPSSQNQLNPQQQSTE